MKKSEVLFGLLRIPVDALAVFSALVIAYRLRELRIDLVPGVQLLEPAQTLLTIEEYLQSFVTPGVFGFLLLSACLSLYVLRTTRSSWNEIARLIVAAFLWLIAVIAWYFLVRKQLFYSRMLLIHAGFLIAVFGILGRVGITLLQRAFLRLGVGVRYVVSVGGEPIVPSALRVLKRDVRYRYLGHWKTLSDLRALSSQQPLDLVLQTDPNPRDEVTGQIIDECRSEHIDYAFLPPVLAENPHQLRIDRLGLVPMLSLQPTPLDGWGRVIKRFFDALLSVILLVLLSPFLLLIAIAILLTGGFPIFYVSRRIGQHARGELPMLKFRTMVREADQLKAMLLEKSHRSDGPLFKIKNDPRVTTVGKFLRRFSLDELPQLLNVLLGQMSLVGPRPHLPEEVGKYTPYQRRVFAVKPGVTGLSQVSGRSDLPFADEVRLDLRYVEEWSPVLDLWILWRTVWVVLGRKGAD